MNGSLSWSRKWNSEIKVIAIKVPRGTSAKALTVRIEPRHLELRLSLLGGGSEVLLSGRLARGIIPGDSTWTMDKDEGCLIVLQPYLAEQSRQEEMRKRDLAMKEEGRFLAAEVEKEMRELEKQFGHP
eukprot:gene28180-31276_t